eukprot:CAMPEP_0119275110 /NCGR_PEP_ID=MMETSP1329-20130426/13239_1 /TAXON_ID=114041 /ORGANISM="Genus nov. species nov., Strain RCC1024" /LENGTH=36 /DNA_ID= /DNA_START= /DNA_END= /DNA_ORIENTATION=
MEASAPWAAGLFDDDLASAAGTASFSVLEEETFVEL